MRSNDNAITEELYRVFRKYPFPSTMSGCPCCVSDEHLKLLRSKPLRQLGGEEMGRYAFKAMTTWGTEEDFKYYLPRLFELYLSGIGDGESYTLLDKLYYGKWNTWPADEQDVIKQYLADWYKCQINTWRFDTSIMNRLRYLCDNDELLTGPDDMDIHNECFRYFIWFALDHFNDREAYWLRNWIYNRKHLMQQAFFHFEDDKHFSKVISDALFIVEHTYDYPSF